MHTQEIIEYAFAERENLNFENCPVDIKIAVEETINQLDQGHLRIVEKINNEWQVQQWLKKAILLYFRLQKNFKMDAGLQNYFDKIPTKFSGYTEQQFQQLQIRIVPQACVRYGSFINKNSILMPSFVNIGAYIDSGVMVDTWATVGSCAFIGKNVHLSGGVGIGGVLEPLQANPVIIEDNCFVGARSEIVEGVIVEENAVISMGVFIGASTRIYDRETKEIFYGRVPKGSVVVPGNLPSADGTHSLYAAIIVKKVDEKTRQKVAINDLLRIQ